MDTNVSETSSSKGRLDSRDVGFLIFLAFAMAAVIALGTLTFKEGLHVENAKQNGEAWMNWLAQAGPERMSETYEPQACAGTKVSDKAANTWGDCMNYLRNQSQLNKLVNTFSNQPVHVVEKCIKSDLSTRGAISFSNIVSTPVGSAVPSVTTPLIEATPIDSKLLIRITVCDKGGYPSKVGEIEF